MSLEPRLEKSSGDLQALAESAFVNTTTIICGNIIIAENQRFRCVVGDHVFINFNRVVTMLQYEF